MSVHLMGGARSLSEMKEFAALPAKAQRYICRALDVALDREESLHHFARNPAEARAIEKHRRAYLGLAKVRRAMPDDLEPGGSPFLGALVELSSFDLGQGQISSFTAYRFLYERLLGSAIRPWLPGAFCGAASLPNIAPSQRGVLLKSISEAAVTSTAWSDREPVFFPDWIHGDEFPAR
jgi:hypothetical protein